MQNASHALMRALSSFSRASHPLARQSQLWPSKPVVRVPLATSLPSPATLNAVEFFTVYLAPCHPSPPESCMRSR